MAVGEPQRSAQLLGAIELAAKRLGQQPAGGGHPGLDWLYRPVPDDLARVLEHPVRVMSRWVSKPWPAGEQLI
jgi:hypothetical protein